MTFPGNISLNPGVHPQPGPDYQPRVICVISKSEVNTEITEHLPWLGSLNFLYLASYFVLRHFFSWQHKTSREARCFVSIKTLSLLVKSVLDNLKVSCQCSFFTYSQYLRFSQQKERVSSMSECQFDVWHFILFNFHGPAKVERKRLSWMNGCMHHIQKKYNAICLKLVLLSSLLI